MTERELTTPVGVADRLAEVQVVDVREDGEWRAGRVEGSIHLPLDSLLAGAMDGIRQDRPVVAVCRSGGRSEVATLMLRARGFEAFNLEGGLEAWEHEGLPLTASNGTPGRVA